MHTSFSSVADKQFVTTSHKTYRAVITHKVQVNDLRFANETSLIVKQQILDRNDVGFVLCVELQQMKQKANDDLAKVMEDIAPVSEKVVFQTDGHGNMVAIINKQELIEKWINLKPALHKKYNGNLSVLNFFDAYEQELAKEEALITSMKHKSIYGIVMAGIYGHDYAKPFARHIVIDKFFNEVDLPITITTEADDNSGRLIHLKSRGAINEEMFNEQQFNRLIKTAVDNLAFKVDVQFTYWEDFLLNQPAGLLSAAEQYLKVEVPGAYYNEIFIKLEINS